MDEKEKRRKRFHHKKRVINNRLKLVKAIESFIPDRTSRSYFQTMNNQSNRLNKKHPYDCGKAKCYICHSEKLLKKKKIADKKKACS